MEDIGFPTHTVTFRSFTCTSHRVRTCVVKIWDFLIFFYLFAPITTAVSSLEKASKSSSSPTRSPSVTKVSAAKKPPDSLSVPLANSFDILSDDDHADKQTSSSTSSSILDSKPMKIDCQPTSLLQNINEHLKSSSNSLDIFDNDVDKIQLECQERKGSVPLNLECKVKRRFFKFFIENSSHDDHNYPES